MCEGEWDRNFKLQVCVIPFEYSFLLSFIIAPSITSLEVTKLNRTTFNLSVSLAYTGGGAITHFRVSFRNTGTTSWISPEDIPVTQSPDSGLVWSGVVSRDEFDTSASLTFQVLAVNMEGLVSAAELATCPPSMSVVINKSLLLCVYHSLSHLFLLIPSYLLISSTHSLTNWFQCQSQCAILYSNYIYWYDYITYTATV